MKRLPRARGTRRACLAALAFLCVAILPVRILTATEYRTAHLTAATDWPLFGNSYANTRFSPLAQIGPANVARLHIAWRRDEGFGQFGWESFPVVMHGRMFLTTNTDQVWAVNAATGASIWQYTPRVDLLGPLALGGAGMPTNRGVVVAEGRVYELTFDCRLLALSAATGKLLWQVHVADPAQGYYETIAPTAWDGLVFVGASGGDSGVRGFVAAFNGRTGKRVWQHWTVPAPGHSWVPRSGHHGGGAVWMPPTIDPATGMLYVATGNPSPNFMGVVRPGSNPEVDGVLALRARTGARLWFTSLVAHDSWDYDVASPPVTFDVRRQGKTIHSVGEAGKSGYYVILDARTGRRLFSPLSFVRQRYPVPSRSGALVCPGNLGFSCSRSPNQN